MYRFVTDFAIKSAICHGFAHKVANFCIMTS